MQKIQLNIGLKTNTNKDLSNHFTDKLVNFVLTEKLFTYDYQSRFEVSNTENTLIVQFYSNADKKHIYPIIEFLADSLLQDCIAIKIFEVGKLVYSNNPKNDWGEFNEKYFINY